MNVMNEKINIIKLLSSALILITCIILVSLGSDGYIQSIGTLAGGFLLGTSIK